VDTVTPADDSHQLPDEPALKDLPDAPPGDAFDPVAELSMLTQANAMAMNALGQDGVVLNDSHPMVTQMLNMALLEEILIAVGGEGAVTRVLLKTHQQIADLLKAAESQVRQAKLMAVPQHDGRVTRPGHVS
jgi:hypothetical protein